MFYSFCIDISVIIPGNTEILCEPVSHCWGPDGQVIIGCAGGQLLVADAETNQLTVLFISHREGMLHVVHICSVI